MRIFVVGRGFPTIENPMLGIFEFDQAKALSAAGHEVVYLALDLRSIRRIRKFGFHNFEESGVKVCTMDFPVGNVPDELFYRIGAGALISLYKKSAAVYGKPDILHSHFYQVSGCAAVLTEKTGIPLAVTEHSSKVLTQAINGNTLPSAKKAYAAAAGVIAVSPSLARAIETAYKIPTVYIPNVIDVSLFSTVEQKKRGGNYTFISVGNLIASKHHEMTIQAFCETFYKSKKADISPRLIIVGGGSEDNNLKSLVNNLHISDDVLFTGRIPRDKIVSLFAEADCFVLPSEYETFGAVYVEAMAAGLPVIATKCGGPECFVNGSNGILIPVNDEKALARAMETIALGHGKKYDRHAIQNFARENFSPEIIAEKLHTFYKLCIEKKTSDMNRID